MGMPATGISKNLDSAETLLRQWAVRIEISPPSRLEAMLAPEDLPDAVHILCGTEWGSLTQIRFVERGPDPGRCELVYDFRHGAAQVRLRVPVPDSGGCIPSVRHVCPRAARYESQLARHPLIRFCD